VASAARSNPATLRLHGVPAQAGGRNLLVDCGRGVTLGLFTPTSKGAAMHRPSRRFHEPNPVPIREPDDDDDFLPDGDDEEDESDDEDED
jgi:hypothetical protein